jgi:hypothetical protein
LLLFEIKSPFSDLRILKEKILIFLKCKNWKERIKNKYNHSFLKYK